MEVLPECPVLAEVCTSTLDLASRYGGLAGFRLLEFLQRYLLGSRQKPLVRGAGEDFAAGAPKASLVCWEVPMTMFDERERSFEKKFSIDQELKFTIEARRNKLLGHWAAAKLGLSGCAADDYIKEILRVDLAKGRRCFLQTQQ